jgi:hypothetical protein
MFQSHRIRAALTTLGFTLAALAAGSTQAFAQRAPLPDDSGALPAQQVTVHSASNGSPIWVFIVVAAIAAALSVGAVLAAVKMHQSTGLRTAHA